MELVEGSNTRNTEIIGTEVLGRTASDGSFDFTVDREVGLVNGSRTAIRTKRQGDVLPRFFHITIGNNADSNDVRAVGRIDADRSTAGTTCILPYQGTYVARTIFGRVGTGNGSIVKCCCTATTVEDNLLDQATAVTAVGGNGNGVAVTCIAQQEGINLGAT